MKNKKRTSNLNFKVQLFQKSKNRFISCYLSEIQYKNKNRNFIPDFAFQFTQKPKNQCSSNTHDGNFGTNSQQR